MMIIEMGGRSCYVDTDTLSAILARLAPNNRTVCAVAYKTGLRVSDVVGLKTADLVHCINNNYWLSLTEQKTGKMRKVKMDKKTVTALMATAGSVYVFEHRYDPNRHRARQTVYKDFKRAARAVLGRRTAASVHSIRKTYAVEKYRECGNLESVRRDMNHENIATTMLYAFSDKM